MNQATHHQVAPGSEERVLSTLANGLAVIDALAGRSPTLRALAADVGLPRQTVYRIVTTLIVAGWVDRDATGERYTLSPHLWSLGVRSFDRTDLRDALAPVVARLAARYGETVHLAIYDRGSVVYVDKRDGSQPIRAYTQLGGRAPAYCVATGKILLAHRDEHEVDRVVADGLVRHTDSTITEPEALRRELRTTRDRGYAVNRGEWRADVGGIAVPVLSPTGEAVAALGFSGPAARLLPQVDALLPVLQDAARLGGSVPAGAV